MSSETLAYKPATGHCVADESIDCIERALSAIHTVEWIASAVNAASCCLSGERQEIEADPRTIPRLVALARLGTMSAPPVAPVETGTRTTRSKRVLHVKPQSHIEELRKLAEARAAAKKVLKDLRSKQKAEAKKHKRLMSKASKLSVKELREIAEMKSAPSLLTATENPSGASSSTGTGSGTTTPIA